MKFLAHAGHSHEPTSGLYVSSELLISLVAILVLMVIVVLCKYIFKLKPSTQLLIFMAYLLITGVGMYQFAPLISIVALASGITLTLVTTLFQLAKK